MLAYRTTLTQDRLPVYFGRAANLPEVISFEYEENMWRQLVPTAPKLFPVFNTANEAVDYLKTPAEQKTHERAAIDGRDGPTNGQNLQLVTSYNGDSEVSKALFTNKGEAENFTRYVAEHFKYIKSRVNPVLYMAGPRELLDYRETHPAQFPSTTPAVYQPELKFDR